MSVLLPVGITSLMDAPYNLVRSVQAALMVIHWQDNVWSEREMPPKRIWDDPDRLRMHFAAVRRQREQEMRSGGGGAASENEMTENLAANDIIVI